MTSGHADRPRSEQREDRGRGRNDRGEPGVQPAGVCTNIPLRGIRSTVPLRDTTQVTKEGRVETSNKQGSISTHSLPNNIRKVQ